MLRIQNVLILILQEISEAAAIVNQEGSVVYSNEPFNKLFNFHPGPDEKRPCSALQHLNLCDWDREILSALQKKNLSRCLQRIRHPRIFCVPGGE